MAYRDLNDLIDDLDRSGNLSDDPFGIEIGELSDDDLKHLPRPRRGPSPIKNLAPPKKRSRRPRKLP